MVITRSSFSGGFIAIDHNGEPKLANDHQILVESFHESWKERKPVA